MADDIDIRQGDALFQIAEPEKPSVKRNAGRGIGIDLGTTHSLVALASSGSAPRVLTFDDAPEGSPESRGIVPSVVTFADGNALVGSRALARAQEHPEAVFASAKRFMGRGAGEIDFEHPYRIVAQDGVLRFATDEGDRTPVEISAEILRRLKARAEAELDGPVDGAVITVPAYFDDAQRQATKDAARVAGLTVYRLLAEPTAAALAYGLQQAGDGLFAVYDLGGGTFDITILHLDDGVFQVKATGGDSALGGDDMDRALAEILLEAMDAKQADAKTLGGREVIRIALDAARKAKHALTDQERVTLELPKKGGGETDVTITREQLEALIKPIVAKTGVACRRAIRDAGIDKDELDGVILVGGSTRVPYVRKFVAELFGHEPLCEIDPEHVVALGAAIQADVLAGDADNDILLLDVLPLSLGLETMGGVAEKILPRNTTIPAGARQVFTTYADNQTGFDLHVVQGERELATDCRSLARFILKGIPPMAAGLARLEVTFRVDADGLLEVTAKELTTGIEQKVEVKPSYGLTDEEVEQMLLDALDHGEEDFEKRRLVERRVEAERILTATKSALEKDHALLEAGERETIDAAMQALSEAIAGDKPGIILTRIEELDAATKAWAGRRMDKAIQSAIAGQELDAIEQTVSHARGVDAHVEEHEQRRQPKQPPAAPPMQIGEPMGISEPSPSSPNSASAREAKGS